MTTTATIAPPARPAEPMPDVVPLPAVAVPVPASPMPPSPTPAPVPHDDTPPPAKPPELPLAARLHLNLAALGIDPTAPDFGERLCQLSQDNHPYDFEISAQGELIVMPPSGWDSSLNEGKASAKVEAWQDANGGACFPPTVMFNLPSGARYMPDASWISQERYEQLLAGEYRSTIDGAPDFVVEVRSRTDSLADGLAKMQEWMDGGAQLGWYLDPYQTRAYIYRRGQPVEILDNPETLSGAEVMPGFVFEVRRLIFARHPANRPQSQSQSETQSESPSPSPSSQPEPAAEA